MLIHCSPTETKNFLQNEHVAIEIEIGEEDASAEEV